MPRGVDVTHLGDSWHLAKEPQRIEAPLFERDAAGSPRGLRDPGQIMFHLAYELFNPDRRRRGFLVLNA